jgi:hypothetical protein
MKKGCLGLIILFFFFPILQGSFRFVDEKELNGSYLRLNEPELSFESWISGNFQEEYLKFHKDTFGFNKSLVRIYNQYCFSVLNKPNSKNTIIGKEKVLFQEDVIEAYFGEDFRGEGYLDSLAEKFENAQKKLEEEGVLLVAVTAPSKPSFFNHLLPEKFDIKNKKQNNYDYLSRRFKEKKLNYIDFNELLKSKKYPYPIFPKNGLHWSGYSTSLTFQKLTDYIESKLMKKLRRFHIEEGELKSDSLRYTDNDIGKAMNLLFDPKNYDMYYPKVVFDKESVFAPNVLIIGDSYAQSYYGFYPFYKKVFSKETKFWYYNRVVMWPVQMGKDNNINKLNMKEEILSRDVILLFTTEDNMERLGFGFLEDFSFLINDKLSPREKALSLIIENIKNDLEWFNFIRKQAKERKQSIEETLRANAIHVYNSKK